MTQIVSLPFQRTVKLLQETLSTFSSAMSPLILLSMASDLLSILYSVIDFFIPDEKESPVTAFVSLTLSYVTILTALGFSQMVSAKVCTQAQRLYDRNHMNDFDNEI